MKWKTQWKAIGLLIVVLVLFGIFWADKELKPSAEILGQIQTSQEKTQAIKWHWSPDGSYTMKVNSFQTYGFINFTFVLLMLAQNLVHLRTPMMLTRYPTYHIAQHKIFSNLLRFSIPFLTIATLLLFIVEVTAPVTGLGNYEFVTIQIYPFAALVYAVYMIICTLLVCYYQSVVFLSNHCMKLQVILILFLIASACLQGTWISEMSPFSLPAYDRFLPQEVWKMLVVTVLCFIVLRVWSGRSQTNDVEMSR